MDMPAPSIDPSDVIKLVRRLHFPRTTGSDGEDRAFEIIRRELAGIGIPARYEEFISPWAETRCAFLEIKAKRLPAHLLISPALSSSWAWMSLPQSLDVQGILTEEPPAKDGNESFIVLRRQYNREQPCVPGASAQVFLGQPDESFVAWYLACYGLIPSSYLSAEREPLVSAATGNSCRLVWANRDCERVLKNMAAELKGRKVPEEIIVVGAHIDSFPGTVGASDNASGCAMLVAFARWFAKHPPDRTVRFVWFTGEELDRRGSRAYLAARERDAILLYVNVDSGVSLDHGGPSVGVTGGEHIVLAAERVVASDIPVVETDFQSDDTVAFREHGIPTVFVHARRIRCTPMPTGLSPNAHLPTDTAEKLDGGKIQLVGTTSLAILDAAQRGVLPCERETGK